MKKYYEGILKKYRGNGMIPFSLSSTPRFYLPFLPINLIEAIIDGRPMALSSLGFVRHPFSYPLFIRLR